MYYKYNTQLFYLCYETFLIKILSEITTPMELLLYKLKNFCFVKIVFQKVSSDS